MNEERKRFWGRAFAAMCQVWQWFEPTELRILVWDDALSDLSVSHLVLGISYVIRNHSGNQPPTPGEVRDAVLGPLTKCAVTRADGRVTRWEEKRLKPKDSEPLHVFGDAPLRLNGSRLD
jgi:hypothetical protein